MPALPYRGPQTILGSAPARPRPAAELADEITENALQLLFVAQQELAELPVDGQAWTARVCVRDAIGSLRAVADALRATDAATPAADAHPHRSASAA